MSYTTSKFTNHWPEDLNERYIGIKNHSILIQNGLDKASCNRFSKDQLELFDRSISKFPAKLQQHLINQAFLNCNRRALYIRPKDSLFDILGFYGIVVRFTTNEKDVLGLEPDSDQFFVITTKKFLTKEVKQMVTKTLKARFSRMNTITKTPFEVIFIGA